MKSSRGEKWPAGPWPGHSPGSKGRTHGGPQGRRAGFRGQMQICPLGLLSGLTKSSRGEQWPAGREPSHLSGSKGRTRGGPQGRRTGFRGQMQICLLGLLSGLMGSTGCAPANPSAPEGVELGRPERVARQVGKHVQTQGFRTPKPSLRPKREGGNVGFPTGTLTSGRPEPPRGPPDLYANLRCFGAPGPQKPRISPHGSKSTLPAASGRPPASPGASWRPPWHPPPARGASGPRKHVIFAT